jgi:hypothetical protein
MSVVNAIPLLLGDEGYNISRSVRLRSSASAYFNRTPASAGNQSTWTWSGWVKRGSLGATYQMLFGADSGGGGGAALYFYNDNLCFGQFTTTYRVSTAVFRDPSAWYHVVCALDTTQATANNRVRIYVNGVELTSFTTTNNPTQNSTLAFNGTVAHAIGADIPNTGARNFLDGYLTEINFVNAQGLGASSFSETDAITGVWKPKKYAGTYGTNGFYLNFSDNSSNTATTIGKDNSGNGNNWTPNNISMTAVSSVNEISGWDSKNGNGAFGNSSLPAPGVGTNAYHFPKTNATYSLQRTLTATSKIEAYCYIDGVNSGTITANGGTAKTMPASTTTYSWVKVNLGVTSLSSITIANSNWTGSDPWLACFIVDDVVVFGTSAIAAVYDSMIDVPTLYADGGNGRGNYCTLNPNISNDGSAAYSEGNLTMSGTPSYGVSSTIPVSAVKSYWEARINANASQDVEIGIQANPGTNVSSSGGYGWGTKLGRRWANGSATTGFATATVGDIVGFAYDNAAGQLDVYKNNTLVFSITGISTTVDYWVAVSGGGVPGADGYTFNFGQRPFAYTPPTGFKALNTQNLPAPTILKGNQYFDATLWTGNGTSQTITNNGSMQPDLVWAKSRSAATGHILADAVRGASLVLQTNNTNAEVTATDHVTSFNSNGFSIGNGGSINVNTSTYVAWQWKANGSAVTNTSGSITSQVNAGTSQGFSVVTYTGTGANATVGHGLGVAPKMIIVKDRDSVRNWFVLHNDGTTVRQFEGLNTTSASTTPPAAFNNTAPTSSVFSLAAATGVNGNTIKHVAYCFSEVAGFSRFGSYTGNGSTDGPFVFCGFRPRYVMIKRTNSTGDWFVFDTARNTVNTMSSFLRPNWSDAEATNTNHSIDFLSNGFKSRAIDTGVNASGGTFIYMAFAESPFRTSLAR